MTVYGLLCALALALVLAAARKNTHFDVWIRLCVTAIPQALISSRLLPIALLLIATTGLTFGITGCTVQALRKKGGADHE